MLELLTFRLRNCLFAFDLAAVEHVYPMVACRPVPNAADWLLGLAIVHQDTIPVLDLARRFGWPPVPPRLDSHLLLTRSAQRRLGLAVDAVLDCVSVPEQALRDAAGLLPALPSIQRLFTLSEDVVYLQEPDSLLTRQEELRLNAALEALAS